MNALSKLSTAIGDGLVAGFVGTAAMTVSSTLEAHLRGRAVGPPGGGRPPPPPPPPATAKALGIADFEDDIARARFNDIAHWGYGTGWGVVRGLLGAAGLPARKATTAHGAAIWGSAAVTLPALDVAPPFVFWGKEEVAIDLFHHAVYAVAAGLAYELIAAGRNNGHGAG
jgi:hypothetical protein